MCLDGYYMVIWLLKLFATNVQADGMLLDEMFFDALR